MTGISQTNITTNCIIDGNNIFSTDFMGNRECVGVITSAYLEMKQTAELATTQAEKFFDEKESYFQKLVDAGLEVKPKTQEEINAELMNELAEQKKANAELMKAVLSLNEKIGSGGKYELEQPNTDGKIDGAKQRKS